MAVAAIGSLFIIALTTNLALGVWRSRLRRFSPAWFVAIHASIPLLVAIRFVFSLPMWVIPPEVTFALAGQLVGARLPVVQSSLRSVLAGRS
jgi:hypothetical protein